MREGRIMERREREREGERGRGLWRGGREALRCMCLRVHAF